MAGRSVKGGFYPGSCDDLLQTKSWRRLGFFGGVLIHSGQGMPVQDKDGDTSVLAACLKYLFAYSVLIWSITWFSPSQIPQQIDIATTPELIHTLSQWLNVSMTYFICEAVGLSREPGGRYQHFTCGVGKWDEPPWPVTADEKSHSSRRSRWEACLKYFVWLLPLSDVSPVLIDLHNIRQPQGQYKRGFGELLLLL